MMLNRINLAQSFIHRKVSWPNWELVTLAANILEQSDSAWELDIFFKFVKNYDGGEAKESELLVNGHQR